MAVDRNDNPERYKPTGIAIDTPRPVPGKSGDNGQITIDDFGKIPQNIRSMSGERLEENPEYAQTKYASATPPGEKVAKKVKQDDAPEGDGPTTASAEASQKLPEAVNTADPEGKSQVLKNMMKSLLTVAMLVAIASRGNSSTANRQSATTPTGKVVTNAFGAALAILSKKYTAEKVLTAFDNGFGVFGIDSIHLEYRDIVHSALAKLIQDIIIHGEKNIPTLIIPTFTYGTNVPGPLYTFPPDMYVKQYEPQEEIDFPGYILWVGPNGDRIWTQRTEDQPPYANADQEILTTSAYQIAAALDLYVKNVSVTPQVVNDVLDAQATSVQTNGMNLVVGHNSSNKLMSNLTLILGALGLLTQLAQQLQLPKSVVDAGKIGIALTAFSRNMAMLKQMKGVSGSAFQGMAAIAGLGALASIVGGFINGGVASPLGGGIGSLFNSNISTNAVLSSALGAAVTVAGVATAMKYSRAGAVTVGAASNLIRNLGIK